MVQSKAKGNKMERDTAKALSFWMFNDEHTLKREPTSGAFKYNYCGDIFVMRQINWSHFPFLIETKIGYEQHTPTLWQYSKITEWFIKATNEGKQHNQWITFLICQFKNKPSLLFTNYQIELNKILPVSVIPIKLNGDIIWSSVYIFKDLLKLNFLEIFGSEITYR